MLKHCFITENHTSYELLITSIFENLEEFDDILNASPLLVSCEDENHIHYYKLYTVKVNGVDVDLIEGKTSYTWENDYGSYKYGSPLPEVTVLMNGKDVTSKYHSFVHYESGNPPIVLNCIKSVVNIPIVTGNIEMTFGEY